MQSTRKNILVSDLPKYSRSLIICNISFCPLKFLCFLLYPFLVLHVVEWCIDADFNAISNKWCAQIVSREPSLYMLYYA
jgi:hypothetical protein